MRDVRVLLVSRIGTSGDMGSPSPASRISRFALVAALLMVTAFALCTASRAGAANVQFVGNVGYSYAGNTAVLTADKVANFSPSGFSGTLRLELWAFSTPYTGAAQTGYKLAEYTLGQLVGGFSYVSISSGLISFTPPPNGTWVFTMFVTEFVGGSTDDGYAPDDYSTFGAPVVFGPVAPPPPPPPPPPALTPQIGLWWNPNESGSGYALDYKHGVLVITVYSYLPNGAAQWYIVSGPLTGSTFTGTLIKAVNGQCISCAYQAPAANGNDGTMTIVFSSPTAGTMSLPGGRVIPIQPQAF